MRLAARFIATMAVAFVMVPALYADDAAKPRAKAKKDEAAVPLHRAGRPAKAQPDTAETLPVRSLDKPAIAVRKQLP